MMSTINKDVKYTQCADYIDNIVLPANEKCSNIMKMVSDHFPGVASDVICTNDNLMRIQP